MVGIFSWWHYIDSVDNLNYIFTDVFLLSGSYLYPRITFSTGYAKNVKNLQFQHI